MDASDLLAEYAKNEKLRLKKENSDQHASKKVISQKVNADKKRASLIWDAVIEDVQTKLSKKLTGQGVKLKWAKDYNKVNTIIIGDKSVGFKFMLSNEMVQFIIEGEAVKSFRISDDNFNEVQKQIENQLSIDVLEFFKTSL